MYLFHVKQRATVAFLGTLAARKEYYYEFIALRFHNINSGNIVIDGVELEKFEEQEIAE